MLPVKTTAGLSNMEKQKLEKKILNSSKAEIASNTDF